MLYLAVTGFEYLPRRCHHQKRGTPSLQLWRAAVKTTDLRVLVLPPTFCPQGKWPTTGETATSLSFCNWMLHQVSPAGGSKLPAFVLELYTERQFWSKKLKRLAGCSATQVVVQHNLGHIVFSRSDLQRQKPSCLKLNQVPQLSSIPCFYTGGKSMHWTWCK